ncbi:MAG TPA: FtsQ-type POTRA domain-containing protein [Vicinamibacterales bacterium]|jgi:outer membrane protein assembly factor BamA
MSALRPFVFFVALFVPFVAEAQDTIAEIRVHGNHTTPDADVISLSGLTVGGNAADPSLHDAEEKLKASHRFDTVEVRRRGRSIDDPADILIVILVEERAGVSTEDLTPGPLKRIGAASLWLPVLNYEDGYGLTYGVRLAFADIRGERSRLSVPLTWGGERRAGVEFERAFDRGPISLMRVAGSINQRVNPFYDLPDQRRDLRIDADRIVAPWLRVGGDASVAHVDFGDSYAARHTAIGAHATVDTRIDPSFPRNAIFTRIGWQHLAFSPSTRPEQSPAPRSGRFTADARGYVGVIGSVVLALRGQISRADAALPAAEQVLLGGIGSLRGYRAGYRTGDSMAAVSAEARVPFTSALSLARFGVKAFVDAGTTWMSTERLADQRLQRGIGGGLFLGAAVFMLDLDVAWPEEGKPRVHFGMGVRF